MRSRMMNIVFLSHRRSSIYIGMFDIVLGFFSSFVSSFHPLGAASFWEHALGVSYL